MNDLTPFIDAVQAAAASRTPLRLKGGGSKDFYGGMLVGDVLDVSGYRGILDYQPAELCLSARCGTPLAEIEALLAENGQMLPFEPPHFGAATLGGMVAAGLSGPRRVQGWALRDCLLGVRLIDGNGDLLRFGGPVVKNVAGYDVSRLLAGSLGTLGLIAEATFKLLPRPAVEQSLAFEFDQAAAIVQLNRWAGQPWPISASFWSDGVLVLRLSGAPTAVAAASQKLGGEPLAPAEAFWHNVREHRHAALASGEVLWRLALPSATPPLDLPGATVLEWNGGQRWLISDADVASVRQAAAAAGGHATLFRAPESLRCLEGAFAPLSPALLAVQQRLKKAFDPHGIFNPGRLYAEI